MSEDDPARVKVLDRSVLDQDAAIVAMRAWIAAVGLGPFGCAAPPLGPGGTRVCSRQCGQAPAVHGAQETG